MLIVVEHAMLYPLGQIPGEKYCDVTVQPDGRQSLVLGGPKLRNAGSPEII
jgi:hypothetical protein